MRKYSSSTGILFFNTLRKMDYAWTQTTMIALPASNRSWKIPPSPVVKQIIKYAQPVEMIL
jgi:hypothetical protein